jgi:hypothetical protein
VARPKLIPVLASPTPDEFGEWHELIPRMPHPAYMVRFAVQCRFAAGITVQFGVGPVGMEYPWMEILIFPGGENHPVVFERDVLVASRVVARAKSKQPNDTVDVRVRLIPKP